MRGVSVADALERVIRIAAQRPAGSNVPRPVARLEVALPMLTLAESRLALAALERLPADTQAGELLEEVAGSVGSARFELAASARLSGRWTRNLSSARRSPRLMLATSTASVR